MQQFDEFGRPKRKRYGVAGNGETVYVPLTAMDSAANGMGHEECVQDPNSFEGLQRLAQERRQLDIEYANADANDWPAILNRMNELDNILDAAHHREKAAVAAANARPALSDDYLAGVRDAAALGYKS